MIGISGIGVQQILPTTGIGGADSNPAMDDPKTSASDSGSSSSSSGQSPPAPGTGQIIDKTV